MLSIEQALSFSWFVEFRHPNHALSAKNCRGWVYAFSSSYGIRFGLEGGNWCRQPFEISATGMQYRINIFRHGFENLASENATCCCSECRPEVVPGIILGNANRSFSISHSGNSMACVVKMCHILTWLKHGSPEHPGHLVEAHDQLSSLNLLNRKGGRNRVNALCEEQYKDGVALWKQFTDIFRDTMICLVEFSRFFGWFSQWEINCLGISIGNICVIFVVVKQI